MSMVHWLWLATRPGYSIRFCRSLLEKFGTPEAVWNAMQEQFAGMPRINALRLKSLMEKDLTYAQRIQSDCEKQNIQIITLEDANYPEPLRQIADPPLVLYVQGLLPDFSNQLAVSIVGTRKCTQYGLRAAQYFAGNLAQNGCIIVSGMALGIDGAANQAALDAGGVTVAVLGSGVDVCYPWQHKDLMQHIIQHGAVISEYPPGTEPKGKHFPVRNRIITGLSRGTLIVEAPKKSGALISADLALEQGRDVFAVPGDINRPSCAGCNNLIRQGGAELAQEPSDILAHYGNSGKHTAARRAPEKQKQRPDQLTILEGQFSEERKPAPLVRQPRTLAVSEEERAVWMAIQAGNETVDTIVEATGFPAAKVLTALTMLEVEAYVITTGSGYRVTADIQL
ncbi:MAG: DNA-processing protein DprA [Clostridia bacterium]|nr:DNA-processing protein DprA [Clostridia bacterium]